MSVKDVGGDAEIDVKGYGRKKELPDGTVVYAGFGGRAKISGSNVIVKVEGVRIHLVAHGKGVVVLKGKGVYRTKGTRGKWTTDGVELNLE